MTTPLVGAGLIPPEFSAILSDLTSHHDVAGGVLRMYYAPRNRRGGRSTGLSGTDCPMLLDTYAKALAHAYDVMCSPAGGGWAAPRCSERLKHVPVCVTRPPNRHSPPKTFTPATLGYSSIWLPGFVDEPDLASVVSRARVDASHEVVHLFTHRHRVPTDSRPAWKWFDEATATLLERELCRSEPESARWGAYWAYRPELPLVSPPQPGTETGYFAAWFLFYLTARFAAGPNLVRETWHDPEDEGPVMILDRLLRKHHRTDFATVFEDYVCETSNYHWLDSDLSGRFGDRTFAEWFCPAPGATVRQRVPDEFEPFAARYYRLDLPEKVSQIAVRVDAEPWPVSDMPHNLRAALLTPDGGNKPTGRVPLAATPVAAKGARLELTTALPPSRPDHVILAVMNVPPAGDDGMQDIDLNRFCTLELSVQ